jgi:hypothetical protein
MKVAPVLVTVEPASTEKLAAVPSPTGGGAARAPAGLKTSNAAATAAAARPASIEGTTRRT